MHAFTPAVLYALLFSSVPVLPHVINPYEDSAVAGAQSSALSAAQVTHTVKIGIKIEHEDSRETSTTKCKGKESSCEDESSAKCRDEESSCEDESSAKCNSKKGSCVEESTKRYGFKCGKKFFNQGQILAAAKAACPYISKNTHRRNFPAPYIYSKYDKPGPYVQWPLKRNGRFWNKLRNNKQRLVMTMDCTVVGAVVRDDDDDDDDDIEDERDRGFDFSYRHCKYQRQ
ncbi:putative secreted effector protein [Erysiphe neolycopersici]|uniref:Putative secreted effector protein n=1 Tax=Erysiphe neolycopersici TaxID=212602 RepID=A0A420I2K3_9PEZI|nr:putative secreted effector protein [Erysiphe neolycopersici]